MGYQRILITPEGGAYAAAVSCESYLLIVPGGLPSWVCPATLPIPTHTAIKQEILRNRYFGLYYAYYSLYFFVAGLELAIGLQT